MRRSSVSGFAGPSRSSVVVTPWARASWRTETSDSPANRPSASGPPTCRTSAWATTLKSTSCLVSRLSAPRTCQVEWSYRPLRESRSWRSAGPVGEQPVGYRRPRLRGAAIAIRPSHRPPRSRSWSPVRRAVRDRRPRRPRCRPPSAVSPRPRLRCRGPKAQPPGAPTRRARARRGSPPARASATGFQIRLRRDAIAGEPDRPRRPVRIGQDPRRSQRAT